MHLAWVVDEIADKRGFIDEVAVLIDEFLKIGDSCSRFFMTLFSIAWFDRFIYTGLEDEQGNRI